MALNPIVQRVLANLAAGEGGPDQGPRVAQQQSLMNKFVNASPQGGTYTDPQGGSFWQSTGAGAAPGGSSFWQQTGAGKVDINKILATIRKMESGSPQGNYTVKNKYGPSGAYQFHPDTWNNYKGYKEAYLAPKAIQDERAMMDVQKFLSQGKNDIQYVPGMWYRPATFVDKNRWDEPIKNNVYTMREYIKLWLQAYNSL